MRSILESAFYALTNQDKDKADALFREFILERSRQIHESIRVNGHLSIDELLKEDEEVVPVGVFDEVDDTNEDVVDQAPGAFLLVPNGTDFTVFGVVSVEDADNAAQVITSLDGGEATVATAEELSDLLGVDSTELVANLSQSLTASVICDLFADGMESVSLEGLPETVVVANAGVVAPEDEVDVDEEPVDVDPITTSIGTDLSSLVDEFDAEIDKTTLGEGAIDRLKDVRAETTSTDGVDALGNKISINKETGVADVREPKDAKPVVVRGDQHVGFDREAAPKAALLKAKNTLNHSTDGQAIAKAGEPKDTLVNSYGKKGEENLKNIFDKKI